MQMHMTISGEFITEQIQAFMGEGEYLRAFRLASSLSQPDMTDGERIELALGLMYGATTLETNEDGSLNVVPTDKEINLVDALAETLAATTDASDDAAARTDLAERKLNCIYATLYDYDPEALRRVCKEWALFDKRKDDPFLFDPDTPIPEDLARITSPYSPNTGIPLLDSFLKVQNNTEDKPTYGWLDPDGTFYGVGWGEHQEWAEKELKKLGITDATHPGDELVAHGWILIHNPAHGVGTCTMAMKPSLQQKAFLKDYYTQWDEPAAVDALIHNAYEDVLEIFDTISIGEAS